MVAAAMILGDTVVLPFAALVADLVRRSGGALYNGLPIQSPPITLVIRALSWVYTAARLALAVFLLTMVKAPDNGGTHSDKASAIIRAIALSATVAAAIWLPLDMAFGIERIQRIDHYSALSGDPTTTPLQWASGIFFQLLNAWRLLVPLVIYRAFAQRIASRAEPAT